VHSLDFSSLLSSFEWLLRLMLLSLAIDGGDCGVAAPP